MSLLFIVVEYCVQSHMSTEEYDNAIRGLRAVRRFKKYTYYFRTVPELVIDVVKRLFHSVLGKRVRGGRRSLVWTSKVNRPQTPRVVINNMAGGLGGDEDQNREDIPLTGRLNRDRRDSHSSIGGSIYSDISTLKRLQSAQRNPSFG